MNIRNESKFQQFNEHKSLYRDLFNCFVHFVKFNNLCKYEVVLYISLCSASSVNALYIII